MTARLPATRSTLSGAAADGREAPAGIAAPEETPGATCAAEPFPAEAAWTSLLTTRPPGPLPRRVRISKPNSPAKTRASGEEGEAPGGSHGPGAASGGRRGASADPTLGTIGSARAGTGAGVVWPPEVFGAADSDIADTSAVDFFATASSARTASGFSPALPITAITSPTAGPGTFG